ncbi:hypothetical protein Dsin_023774 [Dipteronia sinensis]|uniref:Uncharacterized protein n=1 Tax=Dipteronia sinensis TaxID=43782 RepID=A0AAE0A483_9ROSI|nr:hypothetical protein Dsin_023774 [Dipteronia sinensis]
MLEKVAKLIMIVRLLCLEGWKREVLTSVVGQPVRKLVVRLQMIVRLLAWGSVVKNRTDVSKIRKASVTKAKIHDGGFFESNSIKVFGSNDGSSRGVAVSGNQVIYINFDKGGGLLGSGLSSIDGPAIDIYVDLGDLEHLFEKGRWGKSVLLRAFPKDRQKKTFFLPEFIG